jgi:multidrug resistance efflux pump
VAATQQLDGTRTAFQAAQARLDSLRRQVDAQRAQVALVHTNAEQIAARRSAVQVNEHLEAAAAAQQTKASVRLAYTEIRAPIDGIVDIRAARPGEVVTPGQAVVTLINPDDLWIRADLEGNLIDRVGWRLHTSAVGHRADGTVPGAGTVYTQRREPTWRDIKHQSGSHRQQRAAARRRHDSHALMRL